MKIGERIKQKRREKKLTLEQVGSQIGVSKQTVQRYESGQIENIPLSRLSELAKVLGTTPGYLMGWESEDIDNYDSIKNLLGIN